ncbi:type I phosphomannose isomerase catalytic subunit [Staphylococcus saprophyticus]|jgi:mannose-6-phosphate isomerase|uniref:type I phosphomannose isomerase catalytic subunit n=1 Tax=Staphylococcus saprophyticus TaxID=29385 RepID=UPI0016433239|nr:type I phosphomannose isomerase catalytic subunit [Staphylococcus saprophyticus]MBC2921907.1 class I mannose-6-phosphate isomerase [Staphylococcus saprophyticus]MBC2958470.1 class I mannose-6-phosphate isomerase [Staphylococcus saprophyticus]MBC3010289.1 class I mannose-6-phosphate isomerase [Staphylococcus saprophyticus]MBC3024226.1 class I mannose-6-phosphate isomerase [Staphylococcus saprophyticus]MBC3031453.1 class I mannose-6-phosphate isomerase [Staphylococcus saprophyticus]
MPLFLKPIFHEKIWGGSRLKEFGYDLPSDYIGEVWGISAHPNGKCEILNEPYRGQTLDQVWDEHRELFGDFPSQEFPLMTKIVDARESLSVHVHPDDAYAYENENGQYGKSECWYIIDAEEDAEIIYGLNTQSKETAIDKIDEADYDSLFNKVKVKAGEFYFIPAGTIHSIGAGVLVYETMQSSDVTYRVFDYDRAQDSSDKRELNQVKAKEVIEIANESINIPTDTEIIENHKRTQLVSNDFFTIVKWNISGTLNYMKPREFVLISVLKGEGQVIIDGEVFDLVQGQNFILTSDDLDTIFEGQYELIVSYL